MDPKTVQSFAGLSLLFIGLFLISGDIIRLFGLDTPARIFITNLFSIIVALVCIISAAVIFADAKNE